MRAPDVAFVSQKRLEEVGSVKGYWLGAPDLVVEIISPSDIYTEVEEKVFDWLESRSQDGGSSKSQKARGDRVSLLNGYSGTY